MTNPRISIVVCTYQGSQRIADTLASLVHQSAPHDVYEVVVVDNDSSDQAATRGIVSGYAAGGFPTISLAIESDLGLSHARNRALRESRGDYLLFIDDDALASPRYVERHLEAIEGHDPDVIGGNVNPLFESPPPAELGYGDWERFSLKFFGDTDRWLEDGEYFIGTNMGARRDLLEAEAFDPALGRKGDALVGGEDWFLGESRFRRRFVAGADVFHKIPEARLSREYLAKRSADARTQSRSAPSRHTSAAGGVAAGFLRRELQIFQRRLRHRIRLQLARTDARGAGLRGDSSGC